MLKTIAIDDEPVALEVIKSIAKNVVFIELAACFTNAFEAIAYLQQNKIDLIFLDIKMPDISGIDFLKTLSNPPMVIFTTAYSEHAVQSFELDAIDYLLKPFSLTRFLKACNKAFAQYSLKNNNTNSKLVESFIFIKSGYEQIRVELNNILYVESSGNYVQFVLTDAKIISRLTMAEAEEVLPSSAFVRIHRSFIVAKSKITRAGKNNIWIGNIEIPVGAAYADEVDNIIK